MATSLGCGHVVGPIRYVTLDIEKNASVDCWTSSVVKDASMGLIALVFYSPRMCAVACARIFR
jgi:hypothetical protein